MMLVPLVAVGVRLHPQPPVPAVRHLELALELFGVPLIAELQQLAHHRVQRQPEEILLILVLQQLLVPDQLFRFVRQFGLDRFARLPVVAANVRYRRVQIAELQCLPERQFRLRQKIVLLRMDVLQRGKTVQLAVLLVQILCQRVATDRHVKFGERGCVLHLQYRHPEIKLLPKYAARMRLFCVFGSNSCPAASIQSATAAGSLFCIRHRYSSD
uniref:Uncharacterized protein n=1 Tax=Anopheles culicifacies TaxID=139723 RepID=A0A182M6G5_9DIPT